jgi:hypothetical protein
MDLELEPCAPPPREAVNSNRREKEDENTSALTTSISRSRRRLEFQGNKREPNAARASLKFRPFRSRFPFSQSQSFLRSALFIKEKSRTVPCQLHAQEM